MTEEKTFESSLLCLEEIIRELEKGEVPLNDMLKKYEEAMGHLNFCEESLANATKTVNKILNEDGSLSDYKVEE
ncbi:MAG: exodeoxyribonuclease VII small subunit [Bacilli bacterium]|nr:exodeoxyribonuclease VII small subunit [Bacilli bacterium]